ncbi:MAG: CvpA family protein [Fidelibacterota bacterium]
MPVSLIDLVSLLLMAGTGYLGYHRGALAELSQMGALIVALILSLWIGGPMAAALLRHFPGLGRWTLGILFGVIFVLVYLALRLIFRVLEYLADNQPRWINRLGGVLVGLIKGAILLTVAVMALEVSSGHRWVNILRRESTVINTLYTLQSRVIKTLNLHFPTKDDLPSTGMEI